MNLRDISVAVQSILYGSASMNHGVHAKCIHLISAQCEFASCGSPVVARMFSYIYSIIWTIKIAKILRSIKRNFHCNASLLFSSSGTFKTCAVTPTFVTRNSYLVAENTKYSSFSVAQVNYIAGYKNRIRVGCISASVSLKHPSSSAASIIHKSRCSIHIYETIN